MEILADLPEVTRALNVLADRWGVSPKELAEDAVYTMILHAKPGLVLVSREEVLPEQCGQENSCSPRLSKRL